MAQSDYFPTTRSLVSVEALADALEATYGLSTVRCQLIKGMISDTYRVTAADGSAILRIHRHNRRTPAEIEAELDFLAYLQAQGLQVSLAIPQRTGERLLPIHAPEGLRYAVLFTYAMGQTLSHVLDARTARGYGRAIAHLHALADAMPYALTRPSLDLDPLLNCPLTALDAVLVDHPDDLAYLHHSAAVLRHKIAALPMDKPRHGLCHGDVDSSICRRIPGDDEMAEAFVAGYQELRTLEDDERRSLPLFQAVRTIWSLGIFAINVNEWGSFRITDRFVDRTRVWVERLMEQIGSA